MRNYYNCVCCFQDKSMDEAGMRTHLQIVWCWAELFWERGISLLKLKSLQIIEAEPTEAEEEQEVGKN